MFTIKMILQPRDNMRVAPKYKNISLNGNEVLVEYLVKLSVQSQNVLLSHDYAMVS